MENEKTEWLTDSNGNKCSVQYFGSREAAQKALDSLKNCTNCSYCSRCSGKKGAKPAAAQDPLTVPKIENIHSKVLAAVSQPKALNMKDGHTCATTHCRAGWVVTLAGEAGKKLEAFHNTELAAALIYRESSPHKVSAARFYDDNENALNDIKRMAELEKSNER